MHMEVRKICMVTCRPALSNLGTVQLSLMPTERIRSFKKMGTLRILFMFSIKRFQSIKFICIL